MGTLCQFILTLYCKPQHHGSLIRHAFFYLTHFKTHPVATLPIPMIQNGFLALIVLLSSSRSALLISHKLAGLGAVAVISVATLANKKTLAAISTRDFIGTCHTFLTCLGYCF
jgi:hypothetical protein